MSGPLITIEKTAVNKKKKWYRSPKLLRHSVMAFFFLFLLHVAYDHQVKGGGPNGSPSIEAYCPFGGLESLYQFLTTGGFIRRIEASSLILFIALMLLILVASRGFCGWICPFGSLQEWIGMLGKKIFKNKFNPTGAWDRRLRYLKYVILVAIIGFTWHLGTLVFRDYDPFLAFFHLGKEVSELRWAYIILGVVLVGSIWIDRFFCKYACPLGAVIGLLSRFGLSKVHRDPTNCKECNVCQKSCPAHIDFISVTTIRDPECNHCMDCVVDCPKPNVLTLKGSRWRFSHPVYASMLVLGLFALIGTTKLAGKWQTSPEAIKLTNQAGELEPEFIRGWMSFDEVSSGFGLPLQHLYEQTGLPESIPSNARMNTIAKEYNVEFEPDRIREIVRAYLSGESSEAAIAGSVDSSGQASSQPGSGKQESGEGQEVKGFMTLKEIELATGVPADYILGHLDLTGINTRQPVREWMHDHNKSITDLRNAVTAYRTTAR